MVTATKTESLTFSLATTDLDDLDQTAFADGYGLLCDTVSGGYKCGPASGGASLPSQTGNTGKYLTTDGTTPSWGTVSGGPLPSQTGNNGKYLTTDGTTASWAVVTAGPTISDNNNFTPSWTAAGTAPSLGNGSITGKWHRNGKWMDVDIYMSFGSTTTKGTSDWYFSLPSGYTIDTSYMASSVTGITVIGSMVANRTGTSDQGGLVVYQDTGKFKLVNLGSTTIYWNTTVPVTWASGDQFSIKARFPISGW